MNEDVIVDVLPNYRRAKGRWPQAPALAQYSDAIANCVVGNGHGVVEHIKSFIECVCITILGEFGEPLPSNEPTSTELLVAALRVLGLQNSRGASKLDKVLSAFNRLSDALGEMRNENGPVAHGKDGFLDALEEDHSRAFLHTGDAIVGVLLNALEGKQPNLLVTREPYERFSHLCERIDRAVVVSAKVDLEDVVPILVVSLSIGNRTETIDLRIEPSRLLYGIDRTAFVGVLNDVPLAFDHEGKEDGVETVKEAGVPDSTVEASGHAKPPSVVLVTLYSGMFSNLRDGLRLFLVNEGIVDNPNEDLVNSLLATAESNSGIDWRVRDGLQARMRVGLRRVLLKEKVDPNKVTGVSERILTWLKVSSPAEQGTLV